MGNELTRRAGRYWVLFYQPLPEAGERIALALVFEDGKRGTTVEYDSSFAKVLKLYPDVDAASLAFGLEALRNDLDSSLDIETVLNSYGPQLEKSEARQISSPVSRAAVDTLMMRYILPAKRGGRAKRRQDKVSKEIEAYVRGNMASSLEVQTNVAAIDILGKPIPGTKRLALAIHSDSGWMLVDGVDLNQLTPQAAANRADDISRTFWNYNRAAEHAGVQIRSVGVVLNGRSHLAVKTHEAHDYALHRFQADSNLAIDAASNESRQKLREFLQKV